MARLTGIILENFKAFKHRQVIPVRPLTLIFGPNSAGKSSIIHALALLRHAFKNKGHAEADRVDLESSEVRLGGWQNLIHGHDGNSTFKIGLKFETSAAWDTSARDQWEVVWEFGRKTEDSEATVTMISALRNDQPEFDGSWDIANLQWHLARFPESLHSERYSPKQFLSDCIKAGLKTGILGESEESNPAFHEWIEHLSNPDIRVTGLFPDCKTDRDSPHYEFFESQNWDLPDRFLDHLYDPSHEEGSSSAFSGWSGRQSKLLSGIERIKAKKSPTSDETNALHEIYSYWVQLISDTNSPYDSVARDFEQIVQNHLHLDSVRERPKFALNLRDLPDDPKYRLWEQLIPDDPLRAKASNALETLTRQPGQTTGYTLDMRNRTIEIGGDKTTPSIKSTTQEMAVRNPQGLLLGIEDVGYGISTVLPIVTAINSIKQRMISVEQPELHIHPRLQTELGDLFLKSTLGSKHTLLIETHSEHLILRVLRRIRETTLGKLPEGMNPITKESVGVLFVNPSAEGSIVSELRITDKGKFLDRWPGGFFEESFDEMF